MSEEEQLYNNISTIKKNLIDEYFDFYVRHNEEGVEIRENMTIHTNKERYEITSCSIKQESLEDAPQVILGIRDSVSHYSHEWIMFIDEFKDIFEKNNI